MEQVREWNKFVKLMIATKKAWESLAAMDRRTDGSLLDLPPEAQKILIIANTRSKFEVAVPRLMDRWRAYGGLERLVIPVPRRKKEESDDE